jgi:hypothetical protein
LFPFLEENLGPLTESHKKLVAVLEVIRVEDFIAQPRRGTNGRPPEDRRWIARAFVAKAVLSLPHTRGLIDTLRSDANLRRICGWELRQDVPSEASFSRAFAEFSKTNLPERVHETLIRQHVGPHVVGHLSRDSTAIEGREKPVKRDLAKKSKSNQPVRKRGRPRKGETPVPREPTRIQRQAAGMELKAMLDELPSACDVGSKKNSQGYSETWRGYKFHIDWAENCVPISCMLTSASVHDSQAAIPLALISAQRITNRYDLMDAAYDAPAIREVSWRLGHVPIIDQNPRRKEKIPMDPATAMRFRERSNAERGNSQLKDNLGGWTVRVRGAAKVKTHLMFGIVALTAFQLLRWLL